MCCLLFLLVEECLSSTPFKFPIPSVLSIPPKTKKKKLWFHFGNGVPHLQALFQILRQWQSLRRPHEGPSHCHHGATTPSAHTSRDPRRRSLFLLLLLRWRRRISRRSQENFQHSRSRNRERNGIHKPISEKIQKVPETAAGTEQLCFWYFAGGRPRHVSDDALTRSMDETRNEIIEGN